MKQRKRCVCARRFFLSAFIADLLIGQIVCYAETRIAPAGPVMAGKSNTADESFEKRAESLRNNYDAGFDLLTANLRAADGPDALPLARAMQMLINFRKYEVHWAEYAEEGYIILENGRRTDGWLALIPFNPETFKDYQIARIESQDGIFFLNLASAEITGIWAGISLCKQLSNLYDQIYNAANRNTIDGFLEGELRAYLLAATAADCFSGKKFSFTLDELIRQHKISSPAQAVEIKDKYPEIFNQMSLKLDAVFPSPTPLSAYEADLRKAFYLVALCLKINEGGTQDEERALERNKEAIRGVIANLGYVWIPKSGGGKTPE